MSLLKLIKAEKPILHLRVPIHPSARRTSAKLTKKLNVVLNLERTSARGDSVLPAVILAHIEAMFCILVVGTEEPYTVL